MQVNDWLMRQVDILCQTNLAFCQPNHNHKMCPPHPPFQHTNTPTLLHFLSSFPTDVPQWHWCYTSSCLTSESSCLSSKLHILSKIFLAPVPENLGSFVSKGWCFSIFGQWFHSSEEPWALLTPAAFTLVSLNMKNRFCVTEDTKPWAVGTTATLLTRLAPPAELLMALFGGVPVTSMWTEVPPCGWLFILHFLHSFPFGCLGVTL